MVPFDVMAGRNSMVCNSKVRSFFFSNFFRKYQLPEVTILLLYFVSSHHCLAEFLCNSFNRHF